MVVSALAKAVREPSEATGGHTERQVLAFGVTKPIGFTTPIRSQLTKIKTRTLALSNSDTEGQLRTAPNGAFFDRAAKTDGLPRPSAPPSLGSVNLGPVDMAEKVRILAN